MVERLDRLAVEEEAAYCGCLVPEEFDALYSHLRGGCAVTGARGMRKLSQERRSDGRSRVLATPGWRGRDRHAGRRLLNRDDLDEAFPDKPLRMDHILMHGR